MTLPISAATTVAIGRAISRAINARFIVREARAVSWGRLATAITLSDGTRTWFVKIGPTTLDRQFEAELDGLAALRDGRVHVPEPLCHGTTSEHAYLVMDYLPLVNRDTSDGAALGAMVALLHETIGAEYGWHADNFIGDSLQPNAPSSSWLDFFRDMRLRPQLERAARGGQPRRLLDLSERLIEALPRVLGEHQPAPSLLHGDLWYGNYGFVATDTPVLFDPAVYYGDRETDLAMTELFGGFPPSFYDTYLARLPVDEGYPLRRELYQLYHVMNHMNLFGGTYRYDVEVRLVRLMRAIG
jgi:protein-ribulosamine 3-kinase